MEKRARLSYSDTLARLSNAIVEAGNTLFATIDQAEAARAAGMTLRPTSLIIFGNPKAGTQLMEAFPRFALELPLKMLVWEEDGAVLIAYGEMSKVAESYGVTGHEALIAAMDRALDSVSASVV